jgi:hypothetical protein
VVGQAYLYHVRLGPTWWIQLIRQLPYLLVLLAWDSDKNLAFSQSLISLDVLRGIENQIADLQTQDPALTRTHDSTAKF